MNAITFLHSNDIVHLDIKPENIFIRKVEREATPHDPGLFQYVLGDFSLSNEIGKIKEGDCFLGEGKYLAPETLRDEDPRMIDLKKVDLYAFGRTLVEIMINKPISSNCENEERLKLKNPAS